MFDGKHFQPLVSNQNRAGLSIAIFAPEKLLGCTSKFLFTPICLAGKPDTSEHEESQRLHLSKKLSP